MEPLMKREALCMDVESNFSEELNGEQAPVQAAKQSEQSDGKPEGKKKKKAWRVMLAPEHAIEIYNRRPPLDETHGKYPHGSMRNASSVALEYNVSPKTIRDIWNRYSWAKVTRSLWTEQEANHYQTTYPVRGHQGTAVLSEATKSCQQSQLLSCGNGAHRPPMQHMHFQHPKYMQQMSQEHVLNVSQQHGFQSYSNSNSNGNKRFRCDPFSQVGGQVPLSHSMNMVDEDLGIGSLDQITQFNDEVDQIVGTLPFGLFPQATMSKACPKVADDSCVPSQGWAMPNIARPFYGVSGVQEMVQHLLGGGVSQTHQVQQQHQQQPQDEIAESQGKLEEQIGQARNRLNKLLALSRQKQWGNDQRNHTLEPMGCGLQMGCY